MHVYQRNINVQVKKMDRRTLDLEAWMLDLGHLLRTLIRVDTETRLITHTEAEMVRHPFPACPVVLEKFHNLRGVKVERGISKKIKEIVGTRAGCVHLMELAIESMKVATINFIWVDSGFESYEDMHKVSNEELHARTMPMLKNSCHIFREEED